MGEKASRIAIYYLNLHKRYDLDVILISYLLFLELPPL
jgi:hypothetical protein